ncbi:MAG: hypothetical protein JWO60_3284, partial [Frankiales bacterium]|nr:hypothetical protein [Frankiales bacterium]
MTLMTSSVLERVVADLREETTALLSVLSG